MVILGLGSNIGDRLAYLRFALQLLKKIPHCIIKQISPIYTSDALLLTHSPTSWDLPYLNLALRCETTLSPFELLAHTKKIELDVGRHAKKKWGPRVIDIDILAWDDLIQYDEKLHIPHEHLADRPFALWPLADVAPLWIHPLKQKTAAEMILPWGSRFTGEAPLHTRQIQQRLDGPQLVGIVNITPDSFSDGGKLVTVTDTLSYIKKLITDGAEIIDIGAEASGPDVLEINADTEWLRLEPLLSALIPELNQFIIPPKISIDTRHAATAKKILDFNFDWIINDVSGLVNPMMQEIISAHRSDVVIMHHLTIPENRAISLPLNQDPVTAVYHWAEKHLLHLEKNGIARDRIIFDVGIGYGKTAEQSLQLLKSISAFHQLDTRLLVGHSRKSFLKQFTNLIPAERDIETIALSLYLAKQNIHYLRVHEVDAHARALKVSATV